MVPAIAADEQVRLELAVEQHLLAARAFVPEIVRHALPGDDRPDLRQHEIGEPVHGAPLRSSTIMRRRLPPRAAHAAGERGDIGEHGLDQAGLRSVFLVERGRDALHQRGSNHRGVGYARDLGRLLRGLDAEAHGDRQRRVAADPRHGFRDIGDAGGFCAGDAGDRHVVDEAGGAPEHHRQALVVAGGGGQADEVDAGGARGRVQLLVLLGRQVDGDQPVDPRGLGVRAEPLGAVAVDRVVVAHQHDRRLGLATPERPHDLQRLRQRHAGVERAQPAAWIAGPSAMGSENGTPTSIRSAPAFGNAARDALRNSRRRDRRSSNM